MRKDIWPPEHTDIAREMLANKAPDAEFLRVFGRSKQAAQAHVRWKDDADYRAERTAYRALKRPTPKDKCRTNLAVPDRLREEASARACAPRTLTALVFGDPPPGMSALDQKRQGASA